MSPHLELFCICNDLWCAIVFRWCCLITVCWLDLVVSRLGGLVLSPVVAKRTAGNEVAKEDALRSLGC